MGRVGEEGQDDGQSDKNFMQPAATLNSFSKAIKTHHTEQKTSEMLLVFSIQQLL